MQNGGNPPQNRPSPVRIRCLLTRGNPRTVTIPQYWDIKHSNTNQHKIGLNPNFLGYSNSPWRGSNLYMHAWFYGPNNLWGDVPAFPTSHTVGRKTKKLEDNRFCVPMHFQTKRFTFEQYPPPPPLLHLNKIHLLLHCHWGRTNFVFIQTRDSEPPGQKPLVVNGVVVGLFKEEDVGTSIAMT